MERTAAGETVDFIVELDLSNPAVAALEQSDPAAAALGLSHPAAAPDLSDPAAAELVADRLWQAGATAVELRDSTVAASFPTGAAAALVASELAHLGARLVAVDPSWRDAWRPHAQPVEIGDRLLVAPAWRDVPVGGHRLVLRIDPGPCFGSGSHASTRLVLAALDRDPPAAGSRVLDAGCGSGILAVAAARLGAGEVVAADVDPAAVETTRANARANGVADRVSATTTAVADLTGPFDLALVNVTAAVHAALGPAVTARVRPGGRIVLSGLLPGQWRHVAPAYQPADVVGHDELDGWAGFELRT